MRFRFLPLMIAVAFAVPARADEVSDALSAAVTAYEAGDIAATATQIKAAQAALGAQQSAKLAAFLPEAPAGWTRTLTEGFSEGLGIAGGGVGVEATYASDDGAASFNMTYIADNPMVTAMGGMLGDATMMAMMGKVVKVGDVSLLNQDGAFSALIGNRVMLNAQGASEEVILPVLESVDYAGLGTFDQN